VQTPIVVTTQYLPFTRVVNKTYDAETETLEPRDETETLVPLVPRRYREETFKTTSRDVRSRRSSRVTTTSTVYIGLCRDTLVSLYLFVMICVLIGHSAGDSN